MLGIRPEDVHDEPVFLAMADKSACVDIDVEVTELMGAETYLYMAMGELQVIARVDPRSTAKAGDTIKLAFDVARMHVFDKESEQVICN